MCKGFNVDHPVGWKSSSLSIEFGLIKSLLIFFYDTF